jgi:hypothetical protein
MDRGGIVMAQMEEIFIRLNSIVKEQQQIIESLANKIEQLESIGGGSTSTEDYVAGKEYKRNVLVVDTNTETMYRVVTEPGETYTSVSIEEDRRNGYLKLVGFESQIVTFNHLPTQEEIDTLPEDTLVAIYSSTDDPYTPVLSSDNNG